jgi:hypothetical protein
MAKKTNNGVLKGKRIICLQGVKHIGKTRTLKKLIKRLLPKSSKKPVWNIPEEEPETLCDPDQDLNVEVWVKGKHIGIYTAGDEPDKIRDNIKLLIKNDCDIIFCASHSWGQGFNIIYAFAKKNDYSLICTAPYTIKTKHEDADEKAMHEKKAEHLETLI